MTDKSPEFIRMCETCGLEWMPEVGMVVVQVESEPPFIVLVTGTLDKNVFCGRNFGDGTKESALNIRWITHDLMFRQNTSIAPYKDVFFPLWSQEQLQGMVKQRKSVLSGQESSFRDDLYDFVKFACCYDSTWHRLSFKPNKYTAQFQTEQQLMLAFVMQELHNKRWTGERWEGMG